MERNGTVGESPGPSCRPDRRNRFARRHNWQKSFASRCPIGSRKERIDPATRTFQALRIAVNDELQELETALQCLPDCLRAGGRVAIISFHSLEDRRVKQAFRDDPRWKPVTKKPIRPGAEECQAIRAAAVQSCELPPDGVGRCRTEGVEVDVPQTSHPGSLWRPCWCCLARCWSSASPWAAPPPTRGRRADRWRPRFNCRGNRSPRSSSRTKTGWTNRPTWTHLPGGSAPEMDAEPPPKCPSCPHHCRQRRRPLSGVTANRLLSQPRRIICRNPPGVTFWYRSRDGQRSPQTHAPKLVSGGQTGVDQGALEAAIELGLEHGGWCPRGRLSEAGPIPAPSGCRKPIRPSTGCAPSRM